MTSRYLKDPDAVLDYQWDWRALTHEVPNAKSDWLAASETITSYTVTVPSGITLDSSSESDGAVTAWLSGGTAGQSYEVTCSIVTSHGREDDRTITITCKER